ncbi:unnamed protein product [Periconia digitata]|uniref:Uncharacterized protein n=1 Tax=Periconia digitata TaxID=1303443 RepID=A0A9W4XWL1_9PLEO|nr:unnamed protein product [Periconia digitata]
MQALGSALGRPPITTHEELQVEQLNFHQEVAKLRRSLRMLDGQIGPSKSITNTNGSQTEETKRLIAQRKHLHVKKLLPKLHRCQGAERSIQQMFKLNHMIFFEYSKSFTRYFTTQFYEKLPRELRDICYDFLLDEETVHQISVAALHRYAPHQKDISTGAIHLVDPQFSHQKIAAEILLAAVHKPGKREGMQFREFDEPNQILQTKLFGSDTPLGAFCGTNEIVFGRKFAKTAELVARMREIGQLWTLFETGIVEDVRSALGAIPGGGEWGLSVHIEMRGFGQKEIWQCAVDWVNELHLISEKKFKYIKYNIGEKGVYARYSNSL